MKSIECNRPMFLYQLCAKQLTRYKKETSNAHYASKEQCAWGARHSGEDFSCSIIRSTFLIRYVFFYICGSSFEAGELSRRVVVCDICRQKNRLYTWEPVSYDSLSSVMPITSYYRPFAYQIFRLQNFQIRLENNTTWRLAYFSISFSNPPPHAPYTRRLHLHLPY